MPEIPLKLEKSRTLNVEVMDPSGQSPNTKNIRQCSRYWSLHWKHFMLVYTHQHATEILQLNFIIIIIMTQASNIVIIIINVFTTLVYNNNNDTSFIVIIIIITVNVNGRWRNTKLSKARNTKPQRKISLGSSTQASLNNRYLTP